MFAFAEVVSCTKQSWTKFNRSDTAVMSSLVSPDRNHRDVGTKSLRHVSDRAAAMRLACKRIEARAQVDGATDLHALSLMGTLCLCICAHFAFRCSKPLKTVWFSSGFRLFTLCL